MSEEELTPEQVDSLLSTLVRWRLVKKRYMAKDGLAGWYYHITWFGMLAQPVLWVYSKLRGTG